MKKLFIGLMAILMSASMWAERVTQEDAALVANHFMNPVAANGIRKANPKRMALKAAATDEAMYYVYENADGEGWVLVAADDAIAPILAYSHTGHFRTDNLPVNVRGWLGKYNAFINKVEADGVVASEEAQTQWKNLRKGLPDDPAGNVVVGPLVKTTWDQDSPYWNLCPGSGSSKAYTGCVATAMAQVMNYWQWPEKGTGSRTYQPKNPNTGQTSTRYGQQTANFGTTEYDWANMLNSYAGSYTDAQAKAVATLMFHCGVATDMMYGNSTDGGSGTYTVNYGDWDWSDSEGECAQNALYMFFGYKKESLTGYMREGYSYEGYKYYDSWTDAAWTAMIKEELDKQHPIMYGGAGDDGGHSFICDGYDDKDYFHFNWGWSGENDGYYKLSNLVPGSGGAGGGSYSFSEDQDVIIGIVPDREEVIVDVTGVSVTPKTATIKINGKVQLSATVLPAEASNKKVTWSSNKTNVATVNEKGLVVGVSAGTAKITVTTEDGEFTADATITVTNEVETVVGCDEYSYVFTAKMASSAQLGDLYWSLTMQDASYTGYDSNRGAQFGSGNSPAKTVSLVTENVADCLIGEITVNAARGGQGGDGKLAVYIDGQQLGTTQSLTSSAADYTFKNTKELQGNLEIRMTNTKKALYLKSINFTPGEGTGTAIETTLVAPKAVKMVENGQVIILRDGVRYNVLGQVIE